VYSQRRGATERLLLTAATVRQRLLLIDNIDYLPSTAAAKESVALLLLSSTSFTSAVLQVIDTTDCLVVATCTSIQGLEPALMQPYRLGKPIVLNLPTKSDRLRTISAVLSELYMHITFDAGDYSTGSDLCNELALRTQGFSTSDIMKLLREQCQRAGLCHDEPTATLTASQLLQAVAIASVSAAQLSASQNQAMRFVRPAAYDAPEPVLFGMTGVQNQLLRLVGTLVPELVVSPTVETGTRSAYHVRKCSGMSLFLDLLCYVRSGTVHWFRAHRRTTHTDTANLTPQHILSCAGMVLCGPSGSGKTALAEWLAHACRKHCRFISVPCADLMHKVSSPRVALYYSSD
jgi:hypothetical protein